MHHIIALLLTLTALLPLTANAQQNNTPEGVVRIVYAAHEDTTVIRMWWGALFQEGDLPQFILSAPNVRIGTGEDATAPSDLLGDFSGQIDGKWFPLYSFSGGLFVPPTDSVRSSTGSPAITAEAFNDSLASSTARFHILIPSFQHKGSWKQIKLRKLDENCHLEARMHREQFQQFRRAFTLGESVLGQHGESLAGLPVFLGEYVVGVISGVARKEEARNSYVSMVFKIRYVYMQCLELGEIEISAEPEK